MKLQDPLTNAQTMSRSIHRSNVAEETRNNGPSLAEIRERALRFTSSVAEFTVVTGTIGSRRNASFRRSSTRATTEGRKRNDLHINTIVLANAKTLFTNKP
jgi:hypothetical protein